jgi:membrane protein required for colicin V production
MVFYAMNIIDIIVGVILLLGFYKGFRNGLILEITSLLGLIIGIIGAFIITQNYGLYIGQWVDWEDSYLKITTYIVSFILIVIVVAFIGKLLTKIIDYAALGFVNNFFGGVFGAIKFALILSVLLIVFNAVNNSAEIVDQIVLERSVSYPVLNNFSELVWPRIIEITEENQNLIENVPGN